MVRPASMPVKVYAIARRGTFGFRATGFRPPLVAIVH